MASVRTVLLDFAIIFILNYTGIYMDLYWSPAKQGIHCYDASINYSKEPNTVTPTAVVTGSIFIPMVIMFLFDIYIYKRKAKEVYDNLIVFEVGIGLVFVTCNYVKYNLGMLRPYFLSVCKPSPSLLCPDHEYRQDPMCLGDQDEIKWASLTFPSLHSSITAYGVMYLTLFLFQTHNNGELRTRYENFLKVTLQCFYTTWFVFVAVSRVLDRRHHVTDVIAGSIWGFFFAVLIITQCTSLLKTPSSSQMNKATEIKTKSEEGLVEKKND